jgi:hypothetical protein
MRSWKVVLGMLGTLAATGTQQQPLLPIVAAGLDAYKSGGPQAAVRAWAANAAFPLDTSATGEWVQRFVSADRELGKMVGYEVLTEQTLGSHFRITYVIALHENAPEFFGFISYQRPNGWTIVTLKWDTSPQKVLPASLWSWPLVAQ